MVIRNFHQLQPVDIQKITTAMSTVERCVTARIRIEVGAVADKGNQDYSAAHAIMSNSTYYDGMTASEELRAAVQSLQKQMSNPFDLVQLQSGMQNVRAKTEALQKIMLGTINEQIQRPNLEAMTKQMQPLLSNGRLLDNSFVQTLNAAALQRLNHMSNTSIQSALAERDDLNNCWRIGRTIRDNATMLTGNVGQGPSLAISAPSKILSASIATTGNVNPTEIAAQIKTGAAVRASYREAMLKIIAAQTGRGNLTSMETQLAAVTAHPIFVHTPVSDALAAEVMKAIVDKRATLPA